MAAVAVAAAVVVMVLEYILSTTGCPAYRIGRL